MMAPSNVGGNQMNLLKLASAVLLGAGAVASCEKLTRRSIVFETDVPRMTLWLRRDFDRPYVFSPL